MALSPQRFVFICWLFLVMGLSLSTQAATPSGESGATSGMWVESAAETAAKDTDALADSSEKHQPAGSVATMQSSPLTGSATYWELLHRNGVEINCVLGLLAFLVLFLFFLSVLTTRKERVVPKAVVARLLGLVQEGRYEDARDSAMTDSCLFAQVVLPALKLHDHPVDRIHQVTEGAGRRAVSALRQRATYLANIAVLCPMLGLLGTVIGMTEAFQMYGEQLNAVVHQKALMGAIAKAMITTLVGLIVGIPAMAMHYIAIARVNRIADELELASEDLVATMGEHR